jgi:MFS family permease
MSESLDDDDLSLRALLGRPDYLRFWLSRVSSTLAVQIQSVALGWQVYEVARETMDVARSAFFVGMIGLAAFIPVFFLALPAGEAADRYDRKTILRLCYFAETLTVLVLVAATVFGFATLPLLLALAAAFGASRAFMGPAGTALGPMLVPCRQRPPMGRRPGFISSPSSVSPASAGTRSLRFRRARAGR